jgi:hypothetical protein
VGAPGAGGAWIVSGDAAWVPGGGSDLAAALADAGTWVGGEGGDAGRALAAVGDVDGDGRDDLLAGAPSEGGGRAFLLPGRADWTGAAFADAAAIVTGGADGVALGSALAGADLDGDGFSDLAIGVPAAGRWGEGNVQVFLGAVAGSLEAGDADATWTGSAGDGAGSSLAPAADLDGDGLADLLVGAPGAGEGAGAIALLQAGASTGGGALADAPARLLGENRGDAAAVAACPGDADGDGLGDVLAGGSGAEAGAGSVWLVLAPLAGAVDLGDADERWFGEEGALGTALGGGDLDGDGTADLAFAAPGASDLYTAAGITWLFLGPW